MENQVRDGSRSVPAGALMAIESAIEAVGGAWQEGIEFAGAVERTTFDLPNSEDNLVTVVLPKEHVAGGTFGSQAIVRIKSGVPMAYHSAMSDPQAPTPKRRDYLAVVVAGPFAEPDGLRGDAPVIITTAARGGVLTPSYHGRMQVEVLGEEVAGELVPPRFRPLPNSPVFLLSQAETEEVMKVGGDLRMGLVVGYDNIAVKVPKDDKGVLPRYTGIMGTTGGGKSTTVARLIAEAQANGYTVIMLDVEGEYTQINEPTTDPKMLAALEARGLPKGEVPGTIIYHLVGRETANPDHPRILEFCLQFARLSSYAVKEILDFTEAQALRFDIAYDVAKQVLRELDIFPKRGDREQERLAMEIDEFERGYPRLTQSRTCSIL